MFCKEFAMRLYNSAGKCKRFVQRHNCSERFEPMISQGSSARLPFCKKNNAYAYVFVPRVHFLVACEVDYMCKIDMLNFAVGNGGFVQSFYNE